MKISELPRGLKELAELRLEQFYDKYFIFFNQESIFRISWELTPEGEYFWNEISWGNFTPFYNCKVINFKLKDK